MKIKKTLFTTEVEITPDEIDAFRYKMSQIDRYNFFSWVKNEFGLDMITRKYDK